MDPLKHLALSLFLLTTPSLIAQEPGVLLWSASRPLSWDDFKGSPLKTAWAAATTASGISYEYTGHERENGYELDFTIAAYFYPEKSWYQPRLCDEVVLSHEQLHFDISELYARKMRHIVTKTRFTQNAREEVKAIYRKILGELTAFQSKYDHETNYSRDTEKQLLWNRKIYMALNGKINL